MTVRNVVEIDGKPVEIKTLSEVERMNLADNLNRDALELAHYYEDTEETA